MLTPRFRYGDTLVATHALSDAGLSWERYRAVVRAADGSCRPCVLTVPHASEVELHGPRETFETEAAMCARVPSAAPLLVHAFDRAGALCALAERAPPAVSLDALIRALQREKEPAPVALAMHVLDALAAMGGEISDAVSTDFLAPARFSMADIHLDLDGRVFVRPRWFRAELHEDRPGAVRLDLRGFAPEVIRGVAVTPQTPLYMMAYAVYELLALDNPYGTARDAGPLDRMMAVVQEPVRPISSRRADIPRAFAALLDAMLASAPGERPSGPAAVREATRAIALEIGGADRIAPLDRLFPGERERAAREAEELAETRFDDLIGQCEPVEGISAKAMRPKTESKAPSPAQLLAGTDEVSWSGDDRPMRRVHPRLLVDAQPVSCASYARFLDASGRRAPSDWPEGRFVPARANAPVVFISLEDARAYARWAKKRLPLNEDWLAATETLGFAALHGGQVWEWTASRQHGGFIVRGGRYRDQRHIEPTPLHQSWDDGPADDIGFRCVADG